MYVRIYSNGEVNSKISDADEFELFKKSLLDLLKEDETIKNYLTKIIEDENAKKTLVTLVTLVTIAGSLFNSDVRLLLEITDTKKVCYVKDYTEKILVALSLLDVLNTYVELRNLVEDIQ